MRTRIAFLTALISLAAFSAAADDDAKSTLNRWNGWMAESAAHLQSGDYRHALKLTNRTIEEMVDQLGPGDASTELFGTVLTYKALAHAGLGQQQEALWYWQTVMSLYPKVADNDLSAFGEPAVFLKENLTPEPPPAPPSDSEVATPELRKQIKPKFPHGAHYFGVAGELVVQVVVTPDGRVRSPAIVQALPAPTLSYVALEALRRWRFEPARTGGAPIPYLFTLKIEYKD